MNRAAWLIHGDTGTGKTRFLGTVAEQVKVLHLCFDEFAPDTLEGMPGDRKVVRVDTYADLRKYVKALQGNKEYGAVCLDGLTQAVQNHRNEMSGGNAESPVRGSIPLWTTLKNMWRLTIAEYAHLPIHFFIACTSRTETDVRKVDVEIRKDGEDYGGDKRVVPNLETDLRHEIGGYLNGVGYTYKEGTGKLETYHISFALPNIHTKLNQYGVSIRDMADPTFAKVWARINKKGD